MLKELRRNIFGGEFFGRVTGFEVSGEQTKYTVREPDVTNRYIWLRGTPAKQLESNGDYIDAGDYVKVSFPGFLRKPRISEVHTCVIVDPSIYIGPRPTKIENPDAKIYPIHSSIN